MTELIANIDRKLLHIPSEVHWFCPKTNDDDHISFSDDEDDLNDETEAETQQRKCKLESGKKRRELAMECLEILSYDGSEAQRLGKEYTDALKRQLTRCDACIRSYYRTLPKYFESLQEQYEGDQVSQFSKLVDDFNIDRIKAGLEKAKRDLLRTPEEERSIRKVDQTGLFGMFEALSCTAFLLDEDLLSMHFDRPFKLVRTNKPLKLNSYSPAATIFLFGDNEDRYNWAYETWVRIKKTLTRTDFDWAIRDHFRGAIEKMQMHYLDKDFLSAFWNGARVIISRLDKDLITHSLRAMDIDIYRLALDHLNLDFEGIQDLLATIKVLLVQSPDDFWDAMGTISAVTVIEQIFNGPSMEKILRAAGQKGANDLEDLADALSWVELLLTSLKPNNQAPACRALVNQFLGRLQSSRYSQSARDYFREMGFAVLESSLRSLINAQAANTRISEATISEMLGMVEGQMSEIAGDVRAAKATTKKEKDAKVGLKIVQHAVSLDCQTLLVDFERLTSKQSMPHNGVLLSKNQSEALWRSITENVTKDDVGLAAEALLGCRELIGLEPFAVANGTPSPDIKHFNESFKRTSSFICVLLHKLSDFSERTLKELFDVPTNASAIYAALFSSDQDIHDAALEVLKAAGSATGRREAVEFATQRYFSTTLSMSSNYVQRITQLKIFTPMTRAVKFCGDMVDVLCNSQDGTLRAKSLSSQEATVVEGFWVSLWQALTAIFNLTEGWSKAGHSRDLLKDFCRDTMQFADGLFDNYAVFRNAILQANTSGKQTSKTIGNRLLEHPKEAMNEVVLWLRLRDEYLSTKSVSLVCMLLTRLKEESVDLEERILFYIEDIIRGKTRTNLSKQQVAELSRSLENHIGQELNDDEDLVKIGASKALTAKQRQGQLDIGLWKAKAESKTGVTSTGDEEMSKIIKSSSSALEAWKAQATRQPPREQPNRQATKAPPAAKPGVEASEIRRIRQQEKDAKSQRDAAARARAQQIRAGIGGSGVQGIGVQGKDHTPKGEGMYVDSDESSDDGEELDRELFGISAPKVKKTAHQTEKKEPLPQLPVKKRKAVRTQREMRARLAPDLSKLHTTILSWEYFHDGDYPPEARTDIFRAVPNCFSSPVHYKQVFQPLLELEAWQGFVKSREENTFKPYEIKIANRSSVDAFVEVSTTMTHADNKEIQIMEGDIILLSKGKSPSTANDIPHCLSRVHRITRKKANLEILYRVVPGNPLLGSLAPGALLYGAKIQSITPLEREYGALCSLEYYDLCDEIVNARPSPLLNYNDKQLEEFIANYNVNKAQAKAIKSAIDNDAFTLIQGPPGSGKTKTIVAIVGALLSSSLGTSNGSLMQKPQAANGAAAASSLPAPKKLLVCAPSNAAVDELVLRFKEGVKTRSGSHKKINVVRLGRSDAINTQVRDVTLEELVNARMAALPGQDQNLREKTQEIMKEHQKVSQKLNEARDQLDSGQVKGDAAARLKEDFDALRRRKTELGAQIDASRDRENNMSRQAELNRRKEQQRILDESHIICATLSGSGHEMFRNLNVEFETVVVDEAAQCVEMSALIPLKYGCAKCILVGDPKQLPPTVFSKEAARFQYEQSLFVRMQGNHPKDVHLLDTQYRMHPDISFFPSQAFYDSRLLDGPDMAGLRKRPWHSNQLLSPYRFFDVKGQHQSAPKGHSLINIAEIDVAQCLYQKLITDYADYDFKGKIGIITPYKSQLRELKDRFSRRYGQAIFDKVEFNTTDAYQGRESEVIIFSCVRASPAGGIGFLQDIRRMNVGLTRAKSSLWVLGNSESLMRGDWWRRLIENAKERDKWIEGNLKQLIQRSAGGKWEPEAYSKRLTTAKDTAESVQMLSFDDMEVDEIGSRDGPAILEQKLPMTEHKRSAASARAPTISRETSAPAPEQNVSVNLDVDMKDADESQGGSAETNRKNLSEKPKLASGHSKTNANPTGPSRPMPSNPRPSRAPLGHRPPAGVVKRKKPVDPFMPQSRQKRPKPGG